MKRVSVIIILLVGILIVCSNCANRVSNVNNSSSNIVGLSSSPSVSNNKNANAELQETDAGLEEANPAESEDAGDEGYSEAVKFWKPYAPTCNGITYMKTGRQGFIELNGFHIAMEYVPITQADRLNGIEAKGLSRIQADTHRLFYDSKWHEWANELPASTIGRVAHFKKYKGQWTFEGGAYFSQYAYPMDCSEIPSSTSTANPLLRFDGVYRAYGEDTNPKDDTTYWLKFYQDGTVSAVANQNAGYKNSGSWWTVKKVWSCLTSVNQGEPCRPEVGQGTYSVAGSKLTYELVGKTRTLRNNAVIKENSVDVLLKNKPNEKQSSMTYEFIEVGGN